MLTMVLSRITMSCAMPRTARIHHRRSWFARSLSPVPLSGFRWPVGALIDAPLDIRPGRQGHAAASPKRATIDLSDHLNDDLAMVSGRVPRRDRRFSLSWARGPGPLATATMDCFTGTRDPARQPAISYTIRARDR